MKQSNWSSSSLVYSSLRPETTKGNMFFKCHIISHLKIIQVAQDLQVGGISARAQEHRAFISPSLVSIIATWTRSSINLPQWLQQRLRRARPYFTGRAWLYLTAASLTSGHLFTALSPQLEAATHSLADPIVCPVVEEILKKWNK